MLGAVGDAGSNFAKPDASIESGAVVLPEARRRRMDARLMSVFGKYAGKRLEEWALDT
jgi:hypothetical protein